MHDEDNDWGRERDLSTQYLYASPGGGLCHLVGVERRREGGKEGRRGRGKGDRGGEDVLLIDMIVLWFVEGEER